MELGVLDSVMGCVMDGVCDGVCDGRRLSQRLSQAEGVTEVWLFGKDSFGECLLGNDQPHNQVHQKDTMSSLA